MSMILLLFGHYRCFRGIRCVQIVPLAEKSETKDAFDPIMIAIKFLYPDLYRYIQYVKGNFRPVLSKEAEEIISSYYRLQRRSSTHNAGICWGLLLCSANFVWTWCEGSFESSDFTGDFLFFVYIFHVIWFYSELQHEQPCGCWKA